MCYIFMKVDHSAIAQLFPGCIIQPAELIVRGTQWKTKKFTLKEDTPDRTPSATHDKEKI